MVCVTTQAHEGIETRHIAHRRFNMHPVTTQAHEGIETRLSNCVCACDAVTTQAHEGIEIVEHTFFSYSFTR